MRRWFYHPYQGMTGLGLAVAGFMALACIPPGMILLFLWFRFLIQFVLP